MRQLPILQQVFLVLQGGALLVLCVRLWSNRLHRVYAYFFSYLVLELLQILVPVVIPVHSRAYRNAFVASELLIVCAYALVVLELYAIVLRNLAGLASASRTFIKIALALSILIALLPLPLEKSPVFLSDYLLIFERPFISSLAVFVLLMAGFLVYYPVPLHRNVLAYLAGYAVLFLTRATAMFFFNLGYHFPQRVSTALMVISTGCLMFWVFSLNRRGETKTLVIGHQWNAADEARLLSQLEAINASLLRATRK